MRFVLSVYFTLLVMFCLSGCGTTKLNTATEQLLMSYAVDATISKLDFTPLSHQKVFLDATYINKPGIVASGTHQPMAVDANYLISSIRQQMFAAGVLLVEKVEEADIVAEPRVGALGLDGNDVTYGLPASNSLSTASAAVAGTSLIPPIPEISIARKEDRAGAAKVAVFAYDRVTRQPIWQSGVATSNSDSKSTWILGMGPFQRGSIRSGTQFAGQRVAPNTINPAIADRNSLEDYLSSREFKKENSTVKQANHEQTQTDSTVTAASSSQSAPANGAASESKGATNDQ